MKIDPADLAKMDQAVATFEEAVDGLVVAAAAMIRQSGRTQAVALMTMSLHVASQGDQLPAIAATALIKLAERGSNG